MPYHRKREREAYETERGRFVERELEFANYMATLLAESQDPSDRAFYEDVRVYARALRASLDLAGNFSRTPATFRRFYELFPPLTHELVTSLLQRREKGAPRSFAPPTEMHGFAMSEVTVEYPVTIRAAETVIADYHSRLNGFFHVLTKDVPDRVGSIPPLINISGGAEAELRTPRSADLLVTSDRSESFTRFIEMCSITLPRWTTQHIRTLALAGHELVHRVLKLVMLINGDKFGEFERARQSGEREKEPWVETEEKQNEMFLDLASSEASEGVFGEPILELLQLRYYLSQHLSKFFENNEIPTLVMRSPQWKAPHDVDITMANFPKLDHVGLHIKNRARYSIAEQHAEELICDLGAIVVAGPAFLYSYDTIYQGGTWSLQEESLQYLEPTPDQIARISTHPPTLVRKSLQVWALRELGFASASHFEEILLEERKRTEPNDNTSLLGKYSDFLREPAVCESLRDILDCFVRVSQMPGSSGCYDLNQGTDEIELQKIWRSIVKNVEEEGNVHRGTDHPSANRTAADYINAIWLKRNEASEPQDAPKHRLEWRVALRNMRQPIPIKGRQ